MSIFATVGTTAFDSLMEAIDCGPFAQHALMQIGSGSYEPKRANWYRFKPSIREDIAAADIVVCHAGAGSVYQLLENGLVPVVVANTERRDKHQLELARWLKRKNYAAVALAANEVNDVLANYDTITSQCVPFNEVRFRYQTELNQLARSQLGL